MPRPRKPSAEFKAQAKAFAIAEVAKGRGVRDVASELAELGVPVSHMTVHRWAQAAAPAQGVASKPPVAQAGQHFGVPPPPPPPPDDGAPFDFDASLQRMIREAELEAKAHEAASNPRGAQAAMRRASEMMKVLAQSEKRKPADPDVLTFSRAEIEKAFAEMSGTLETLLERPLLCSACSKELSVRFGRGES